MSCGHRHFNVRPALLATSPAGESPLFRSHSGHDLRFADTGIGDPAVLAPRRRFTHDLRPWIAEAGQVPASVPQWCSRTSWICTNAAWAASPEGRRVLRDAHLTPAMFGRIHPLLARYADGQSGRNCAVANRRIAQLAGCSRRTVTTARSVLKRARFAIEARRGSGSPGSPPYRRRPSVWHLVSRRDPVRNQQFCALPPSQTGATHSPVGLPLAQGARCASPDSKSPPPSRRRRPASRPRRRPTLHTLRIAGWLASTAVGLHARSGIHVTGQLAMALQASHLDLPAWTGTTLVNELDRDMRDRGLTWPNRINNPGAFLAHRLKSLPARPTAKGTQHHTSTAPRREDPVASPAASPESRRAAVAAIKELLTAKRRGRRPARLWRRPDPGQGFRSPPPKN